MRQIQMQIIGWNALCDKLTDENIELYLSASAQVELLEKVVVGPFESALKDMTGYGKDKMPDGKEIVERRAGNHVIKVEVKPSTSVSYSTVYEAMVNFLNGLKEGVETGRKRHGVRVVENGAYTLLDDVVDKLGDEIRYNTSKGVSQKILTSAGKDSIETSLRTAYVDVTDDFSEVKGPNATIYIEAKKQIDGINKGIIKPFERAIKGTIGFSKENLPDGVKYTKLVIGDVLVYCVSSKADSVRYASIVEGLNVYIGGLAAELDNPKCVSPEVRRFDGNGYISIDAVLGKAKEFKEGFTEPTLRQSISYLRLPRPDKVIAVQQ